MARKKDPDRNWWLKGPYTAKPTDECEPITCVDYGGEYNISPEAGDINNILNTSFEDNDLGCRMSLTSRFAKPWRKKNR